MLPSHHLLQLGELQRKLPLVEVSPGVAIAVLNILGDVELVETAAEQLAFRLSNMEFESLMTAETKSIPLIHALAARLKCPYVVLRKSYKSYMGDALSVTAKSITTRGSQTLYLDGKDRSRIRDNRVVLVDDVISTGSTLRAMHSLANRAEATVVAEAAICTEGNPEDWRNVVALEHLPLYTNRQ